MGRRAPQGRGGPAIRVSAGDPRYPTLVRGFNLRFAGQPRYVEICRDAEQVRRAVQKALDEDLRITVRSGGHCFEDFATRNHGGVLLDLSPMNDVGRDEATGLYHVGAGATLWDVYVQLYKAYGVTLPGGSCYSVGAGGHVLGAGYGFLSRRDGVISDYLYAIELVRVTAGRRAEVITLRRDAADPVEREMLWAHQGGGGGNFGVVTRYWFAAPPAAPREQFSIRRAWEWSRLGRADLARLVHAYGAFLAAHSGVHSPYKDLFGSLLLTHRSAGEIRFLGVSHGERPDLLVELAALLDEAIPRSAGAARPPLQGLRLPWLFGVQNVNDSGPSQRMKYKSAYMNRPFPEGQIDVLWDHLTTERYGNAAAGLKLNTYGCQVNAVAPDATAYPHRSSIMKLQYSTHWNDPAEDPVHLGWIREFYRAMYGEYGPWPDGTFDGCFVSYPDVDLTHWQVLYYKDNYPRLQRVKALLDPLDVFHHRQSIELPHPR